MQKQKNYRNVDLQKGRSADDFRRFLKEEDIYYEASENGNLIHFEVLVDDDEEEDCNGYLDNPDYYWSDERYYEITGNAWDV